MKRNIINKKPKENNLQTFKNLINGSDKKFIDQKDLLIELK